MNLTVKQVSSLEKIRVNDIGNVSPFQRKTVMRGQFFAYQIAVSSSNNAFLSVKLESELAKNIEMYSVKNVFMDLPIYDGADDDYITKEPSLMPDLLQPLKGVVKLNGDATAIWINVKVPKDIKPQEYTITVSLKCSSKNEETEVKQILYLDVLDTQIGEQKTIFTQWFYNDCIANIHNVKMYSSAHWKLIDKYLALAGELGINMILTPIITPPVDTEIGLRRPCTQLVKIEKKRNKYLFDFTLLGKWIKLCKKNGIKYFEMSHLFSQWGLKYAPNILVTKNKKEEYLFGRHTEANCPEYKEFLVQFLPALITYLKEQGVKENCVFHISDEPYSNHLEIYKAAHDLVKPLIDGCPIMDAISRYEFYENGFIDIPVTASDHIEKFLEHNVENQWVYCCCSQIKNVGNRFLSMPSYRGRIIGLQMYKFGVKGFLHWGYNFYNSRLSREQINPYLTTSADKAFP